MTRWWVRAVLVTSMWAALSGCAGVQKATGPVRTVPEQAESILARAPSTYGTRAALVNEDDAQRAALAAFMAALPEGSREHAVHDPALDDVARVTAMIVGLHEQGPAEPLTEWLHSRLGVVGTSQGQCHVLHLRSQRDAGHGRARQKAPTTGRGASPA